MSMQAKLAVNQHFTINSELQLLYNSEVFHDIELQIENTILKSNKLILSLYSSYFKYYFMSTNKTPSVVILPDYITIEAFSIINKWMQTQVLPPDYSIKEIVIVLKATDFLGIDYLFHQSLNFLLQKLEVDNCIIILQSILPFFIQQIPFNVDYIKLINSLFIKEKGTIIDVNPISNSLKIIFAFIKAHLFDIITYYDSERLMLFEIISKSNLIQSIESYVYSCKCSNDLEKIYSFISTTLKLNYYMLFNYIGNKAKYTDDNNTEFISMPQLTTLPVLSFNTSIIPYLHDHIDIDLQLKKKIKSHRREWSIELKTDQESNIEVLFAHYNSFHSLHVGVVALIYSIQIEVIGSSNYQIHKKGTFISHVKYERCPINIFLASSNELKSMAKHSNSRNIIVKIWLGEIPLLSGIITIFSDNFLNLMYRDEKSNYDDIYQLKTDDIYNIIKLPSIHIDKEFKMLLFVINYCKKIQLKNEEEIGKLFSCVKFNYIDNDMLLKIYQNEIQSDLILSNIDVVNLFFLEDFTDKTIKDFNQLDNSSFKEGIQSIIHPNRKDKIKEIIPISKTKNPRTCYKYDLNESNCFKKELSKNVIDQLITNKSNVNSRMMINNIDAINHLDELAKDLEGLLACLNSKKNNNTLLSLSKYKLKTIIHLEDKNNEEHEYICDRINSLLNDIYFLKNKLITK